MIADKDNSLGVDIEVENYEIASMSNGDEAFIIYIKVKNNASKTTVVKLLKATFLSREREQIEQDVWLSGYMSGEESLKSNAFKRAGLIFYKPKLKSIVENDLLFISIELPEDGAELNLCFKNIGDGWLMINKDEKEVEIKLTKKQLERNLLKKIERFEAFEERLGVYFENISVKIKNNDNWFTLFCELHSNSGLSISKSLEVQCVLYDSSGSIIERKESFICQDDFFGFELIEMKFQEDLIANSVSKIRIFPKG